MTWQPIETAPKDGTPIFAAMRRDIYPKFGTKRVEAWNGLCVVLVHRGVYEAEGRSWDHGWDVAAPVGYGGFPDDWIAGWRPIPEHPDDAA